MASYVALLRAVNVGGTGKLPMAELRALCEASGFAAVRTFIASGNVIFDSALAEPAVKAALEQRLAAYAGKPVGLVVRSAAEMAEMLRNNPFHDRPGNQVMAIFLDEVVSPAMLAGVRGRAENEELQLGRREIYVWYGSGMGASKLRIPAAKTGTARNMNTVATLVRMLGA